MDRTPSPAGAAAPRAARPAGLPPAPGIAVADRTGSNEQLTAMTGVVLVVLLAVIGVSILRIHQLIWIHLFVGLVLLGPVALKMASTGYRFVRYYGGSVTYRRKGPPPPALRALAPLVVLSTCLVFLSGIALLIVGPSERGGWPLVHKASFLVWIGATALHVLGHLPGMPAALRASRHQRAGLGMRSPGEAWLWVALAGACAVGLVLALVLAGQFDPWTTARSFTHPHHLQ